MALEDFKKRYGRPNRRFLNRAIRAEVPGGPETLDALQVFFKLSKPHGGYEADGQRLTVAQIAHDRLCDIANAMESAIRRKYGLED